MGLDVRGRSHERRHPRRKTLNPPRLKAGANFAAVLTEASPCGLSPALLRESSFGGTWSPAICRGSTSPHVDRPADDRSTGSKAGRQKSLAATVR